MNRHVIPMALVAACVLAACRIEVIQPPTRTPGPDVRPSARTSAGPSELPTARPSAFPSTGLATPTPQPSRGPNDPPYPSATPTPNWNGTPIPSASAPPPRGNVVIISGQVFDEDGATVDGALIRVQSLDPSVPYMATVTTSAGSWVVNNVPEGANVEIRATKEGWTTRRRVASFQVNPNGRRNVIDFGSDGGDQRGAEDPSGTAYFLSDRPEIEYADPFDDAREVDPSELRVKLLLSEPLTDEAREAFEQAVAIFPINAEAGATEAPDLDADEGALDDGLAASDLDLRDPAAAGLGYALRVRPNSGVEATWNAEGTALTITGAAPLRSSANGAARYAIGLVAGPDELEDPDGNALGTDWDGDPGMPAAGRLIANAFREPDLFLADIAGADPADARWASTHRAVSTFEVRVTGR